MARETRFSQAWSHIIILHCKVTYIAAERFYKTVMHSISSSCTCTCDFTMDKSLAVQTTAEGQTQPLWQGWRRKGGKRREGKGERRGGGEREGD